MMNRRFTILTIALTATVAFLVGLIVAGSFAPAPAVSYATPAPRAGARSTSPAPAITGVVSFADVFDHINPAVVNIDATSRPRTSDRRRQFSPWRAPDSGDDSSPMEPRTPGDGRDTPRRGEGSGFIVDPDGYILTNNHVVERAERLTVKLGDGRNLPARVIGNDPDTDIALIKVDGAGKLPVAPLGDSSRLRIGEWVCAIGNPLSYEHTVTVGVVSYIGRKLFDKSLDNYIQTDAAINFGNSGGPLINARGEVIGINAAISSWASNIGFAVPINQATAILPQLKSRGRVVRGYIGVNLREIDPDIEQSLHLNVAEGALVENVGDDSPGGRAGIRPYDVITSVDDRKVRSDDDLIQEVSAREPGTVARLKVVRDGRVQIVPVKLAERPPRERQRAIPVQLRSARTVSRTPSIGLTVRDLDRQSISRLEIPRSVSGVLVSQVEPMSPAYDAPIERGDVVIEINRQPVTSAADYRQIAGRARPGDVLAFFIYMPAAGQRALRTVRVEGAPQ